MKFFLEGLSDYGPLGVIVAVALYIILKSQFKIISEFKYPKPSKGENEPEQLTGKLTNEHPYLQLHEEAKAESIRMRSPFVGDEHYLLALVKHPGILEILRESGSVEYGKVKKVIKRRQREFLEICSSGS